MTGWTAEQLEHIDVAQELRIAAGPPDARRDAVPIWAVVTNGHTFVRSWRRERGGWYRQALTTGRAAVEVPGWRGEVLVTDVGDGPPEMLAAVDDAYRRKYGPGTDGTVSGMVTADATATTLQLDPS